MVSSLADANPVDAPLVVAILVDATLGDEALDGGQEGWPADELPVGVEAESVTCRAAQVDLHHRDVLRAAV
ncbi:hypothetical protein SV7mr_52430 [Stieleria bergensis]|uniref:Uncharacterized protein n=1 Tax=Stieleria bergensis TaxID=2528025 RepID=A0A517T2T1_9BACT|nr:MAG: hypothetical protein CBB71_23605 [Rhodopirellula sp. TMED11]QDT62693.1 hypothetical protein SV7mr_52430 [Planctomycetes bacterium SV_7m_r]